MRVLACMCVQFACMCLRECVRVLLSHVGAKLLQDAHTPRGAIQQCAMKRRGVSLRFFFGGAGGKENIGPFAVMRVRHDEIISVSSDDESLLERWGKKKKRKKEEESLNE